MKLVLILVGFAVVWGLVIGGITLGVLSALGATDHTKLILCTQVPIIALVIVWGIAVWTNAERP